MEMNRIQIAVGIGSVLLAGGTITYGNFSLGGLPLIDLLTASNNKEQWTGHFIDISDDTGELKFYDEQLTINKNSNGTFEAEVKSVQDGREKIWAYKGFTSGDYLVASYKNTSNGTGIGAIFLENERGIYVGRWTGKTCNDKKVVSCPYILSPHKGSDMTKFNSKMNSMGCTTIDVSSMSSLQHTKFVPCK